MRNNRNRGSLTKALSAGEDEESKASALQVYENLTRATSAQSSTSYLWNTLVTIHEHWFGTGPDSLPVLPLVPESIKAVVASLIKGDYRSAPNYVTVAKDKRLATYPWDTMLEREHHRAGKASTRGLGPSHQCAELPVMLAYVHSKALPSKPRYPAGITNLIVCASFFSLREIEVSLLLVRCVTIGTARRTVTLLLPATKTDPAAHSVTRQWGCVCSGTEETACPYHAIVAQLE